MVTNWDSGFAEVKLRRSPRIKQLSFSRTNSGSFYSGSQPKSRSVQRVHSFQQDKSGNMLAHLPSGVWAYLVGRVFGKSTKFDIFFLDTGAEQVCPLEVQGDEQSMTIINSCLPFGFLQPVIHTDLRGNVSIQQELPVISSLCSCSALRCPR